MKFRAPIMIALALVCFGCGGLLMDNYIAPGPNPDNKYEFDYSPKEGMKLKDPLSFLLISAKPEIEFPAIRVDSSGQSGVPSEESNQNMRNVINDFSAAMVDDLKEILTDKRFRLIQLLENQQMATFGQREQSNFSLFPRVSVQIKDKIISAIKPGHNLGQALLKQIVPGEVTGRLSVKARISFEVQEPITWQLIWVKSIDTDVFEEEYSYKWNLASSGYVIGEDTRPQALASILMKSYDSILDNLSTYIDVDEFTMLSKQALEIRKKATGIIK